MEEDFSKIIFDTYYDSGRILRITLKNKETLDGIFIGFYHGEEGEAYIAQWHFVKEENYISESPAKYADMIIQQVDIETIDFKYPQNT